MNLQKFFKARSDNNIKLNKNDSASNLLPNNKNSEITLKIASDLLCEFSE